VNRRAVNKPINPVDAPYPDFGLPLAESNPIMSTCCVGTEPKSKHWNLHMRSHALLFFATLLAATNVRAQGNTSIDDSRRNAIVRAIETAAPAVVSVNVIVRRREPVFEGFWDLYYRPKYSEIESMGSGFFFDAKGHILTNFHVIENAEYLSTVTLADGRQLEVEFVGGDLRTDLAVLQAKGNSFPRTRIGDSSDLLVGEWSIAIGNPFGGLIRDPNPSATVGVISATHRRVSREVGQGERLYQDMIQTDAAINPGNSGGPLVNAAGEVIGVNTMIFSQSGGNVGLGFAIPINRAKRVAEEIIQYGRRRDPWVGFNAEAIELVRPDFLRELGVVAKQGCLIIRIRESSPAFEAGLRPGDVIVSMNGQDVTQPADIDMITWALFVGDPVEFVVDRGGKKLTFHFNIVELEKRRP
jgi:serine protease Do